MSEQERQQQEAVNNPTRENEKRKALIVSISKYDHNNKFSSLDFCENDANEVYNILKGQGYEIATNLLLVGRVEWSKMKDEIIKFFTDRTLKPEDTLFFYFSGHGYLEKNTGRTYLSTSEMPPEQPERRGIPFDELITYLNLSNSERIMAVLDCCYSGALEMPAGGSRVKDEFTKAEKGEEIASLANTSIARTVDRLIKSGQGKCVLVSSLEEHRSFKMEDRPYSLFTYFLIQGLKGANGESVDINGYVTPELLGSYINKKMYELATIKQKPIIKIDATDEIVLAHYPDLANIQQQEAAFQRDYLLQLLKDRKIDEFNEFRRKNNYSRLNLYGVDLSGRDLSYADLRNSDLNLANLTETKLHRVVFQASNLLGAHFLRADLSNAKLSSAKLLKADLSFANLSFANLSNAKLSFANLSAADLSNAKLSNASLLCADLSFAYLKGAKLSFANLSEADLSNAYLSFANLSEADLSNAYLSNANLLKVNLSSADLSNAKLSSAKLSFAKLSFANLSSADLSNAKLSSAKLSNANLSNAKVSNAYMLKVNLSSADLSSADLSSADLSSANLSNAYLSSADLSNARLSSANLSNANLSAADLSNAKLSNANLSNTDLTGADLSNTDLTGADLSSSIIIGVEFNEDYGGCKNANFDSASIIDDENLSRYFHNNNGKNVPHAIKDITELRQKLQERGFDSGRIDLLFLSHSSLPGSSR
ncbi:MAG: pentapeptide repeat-containing protein [Thermoproteota archaeon]|nr:pentapeptide repeat-containing protein [Thermoproteota archaeon]